MFPESPYFFLKQKNDEESARNALSKIHGSSDQGLIEAELTRLKQTLTMENELAALAGANGNPLIQIWKGVDRVRYPNHLVSAIY